jgi:hypothetical protein
MQGRNDDVAAPSFDVHCQQTILLAWFCPWKFIYLRGHYIEIDIIAIFFCSLVDRDNLKLSFTHIVVEDHEPSGPETEILEMLSPVH